MAKKKQAPKRERVEWLKCSDLPAYLIDQHIYIENANQQGWVRFRLWPAQWGVLALLLRVRQLVVLKARQLGLTWLILAYALWLMIFRSAATVLLFSLRDKEAIELLQRLKGIYRRLPNWARCRWIELDNDHEWRLSNGSRAMAFPTTGGRSYTATLVVVDEADFIPDLAAFLNAVKPTVDAGGQIVLVSTVDKKRPVSTFKEIFRAAEKGQNEYEAVFLPWSARPDRTPAWYASKAADMRSQGNGDDDLYQEYPATVEQALAPLQKDKRIPFAWIEKVAGDGTQGVPDRINRIEGPAVPGLFVYASPQRGRRYVMGADSAEGNPNSDDSVACVLDAESWAQVAVLAGKLEPATFAGYIDQVSAYYNGAPVMAERNNHGHATILALVANGKTGVLAGYDDKAGWYSTSKGKRLMYDLAAETIQTGGTAISDQETRLQLASIEASTLRAPQGLHDDYADAFCLALAGLRWNYVVGEESTEVVAADPLLEYDRGGF